ncbi:hypothetical protein SLA2020_500350 [Shorea laevis]
MARKEFEPEINRENRVVIQEPEIIDGTELMRDLEDDEEEEEMGSDEDPCSEMGLLTQEALRSHISISFNRTWMSSFHIRVRKKPLACRGKEEHGKYWRC